MYNIELRGYCVLFLIICSAIVINCQGAGGGGHSGGSGSYRSNSYYHNNNNNNHNNNGSSCQGSECTKIFLIVMGVCSGIGGLIMLCCCCYHSNGKPRKANSQFVNSKPSGQYTLAKNSFQTGMWAYTYYQQASWHGPYQLRLSFNPHAMTVNGSGRDDVGEFVVDGVFSDRTQRMGLTKRYKQGTGNALENYGHSVTIQVTLKAELDQFEGKWYIQTKSYRGESKVVLKLDLSIV